MQKTLSYRASLIRLYKNFCVSVYAYKNEIIGETD